MLTLAGHGEAWDDLMPGQACPLALRHNCLNCPDQPLEKDLLLPGHGGMRGLRRGSQELGVVPMSRAQWCSQPRAKERLIAGLGHQAPVLRPTLPASVSGSQTPCRGHLRSRSHTPCIPTHGEQGQVYMQSHKGPWNFLWAPVHCSQQGEA